MNLLEVPLSGAHQCVPAAGATPPRESVENALAATKLRTSVWNLRQVLDQVLGIQWRRERRRMGGK